MPCAAADADGGDGVGGGDGGGGDEGGDEANTAALYCY